MLQYFTVSNVDFTLSDNFGMSWFASREPTCCVLIGLMQEDQRSKNYEIGFLLYRIENFHGRLSGDQLMRMKEIGNTLPYINRREVWGRFELSPGSYLVLPTTFYSDQSGQFLIRAYSAQKIEIKELPNF